MNYAEKLIRASANKGERDNCGYKLPVPAHKLPPVMGTHLVYVEHLLATALSMLALAMGASAKVQYTGCIQRYEQQLRQISSAMNEGGINAAR